MKTSKRSTRVARKDPATPPVPRLPHERDESADSQASKPREVMRQAAADLERGLVDTSRQGIQGQDERESVPPEAPHNTKRRPNVAPTNPGDTMGLFDSIIGQVGGALSNTGNGGQGGMMEAIAELINNPDNGGIQGLISAFREKGLEDSVASWIGTGQNLPISGEQIQAALGSEQVQAIAKKLGMSSADVSTNLASLLPAVIDKLTPGGQVPEGGMLEQGLALLKSFGRQA